jgi:hypothetical protein
LPTSATAERTLTPEPPPPQPTTRRSRR